MLLEILTVGNLICILLFVLCFVVLIQSRRHKADLPPGPKPWPFLGNLHQLGGEDHLAPFRKLREKYGDIYSLYFGNKLFVIINGYKNIKDAFVKNGDFFSERPDLYMFTTIEGGLGIGSSSGHLWKEHRSFALTTLREFGFGKTSLEEKIAEEIRPLLELLQKRTGEPLNIITLLRTSVSNIICNLAFGHRFEYDNEKFLNFQKMLDDNVKAIGSNALLNIYPWLRFLPFDIFKFKMVQRNFDSVDNFLQEIVEEHKEHYDENCIGDFTDAYLMEAKKHSGDQSTTFTDIQLRRIMGDFFAAGTETTTTALLWTFLYLMKFPEVQDRIHCEIDEVIGQDRKPSVRERTRLVYTEAVIMETLRTANVIGIGIPHGVSQGTRFHGYMIPKEAIVIGNLDSVLNDPQLWHNPEKFHPERFINSDGTLNRPEEFIPFSNGRRVCLGESLARMELFLFLTSILQRFQIVPPEGEELPGFHGTFGIVHQPHPYRLQLIERCN